MSTKLQTRYERVLFFDGVCNLCNGVVQFVLRHDSDAKISFATLQSSAGQRALKTLALDTQDLRTFVYLRHGKFYTRSTAFLYLMGDLGGVFRFFEVWWLIPRSIRDAIYKLVSNTRYFIFGKRDNCYLPTPDRVDRFIGENEAIPNTK